ncbi:MAG: hypothetical protein DRQ64_08060 [Gammaproteobacteria bacterium]|nr:MAG: hypothetical protein DRQ64_08060 [Gammaproteobacteria bacterium]
MKKLTKSILTLLAVISLTITANAETFFSDNFTITNGGGEVNYEYNNGIRQSGTLTPVTYHSDIVWDPTHHALVTNAGDNAGQCNIHPGGFSPLVDLIGDGNCVIEFDMMRFGTEWMGVSFARSTAGEWHPSAGPGMGLALTAVNTYEIKDHADQVGSFACPELNTNTQYKVRIVMGQDGIPASGDSRVAIFVNNVPLAMDYATANYIYRYAGGFNNNYVTFRNWDATGNCNVDNLSVRAAGSKVLSKAWNDDADSGISSTKIYTHAINLASTVATTTVNSVDFIGSGTTFPQSGVNWEYNNASAGLGAYDISLVGETPNVTGAGTGLVTDCLIDAGGYTSGELTLSGLNPGQDYIINLYGIGLVWSALNNRSNYFATSDGGTITMIDQSEFGADNGQITSYRYTAPANGKFSIAAVPAITNIGGVYCWYAFSNEEVPGSTWVFDGNGAWTNGAMWSGGSVPQPNANIYFTNAYVAAKITASHAADDNITIGGINLGTTRIQLPGRSTAGFESSTNFVLDAGGASPMINLGSARLDLQAGVEGTDGFTAQGDGAASVLMIGADPKSISGTINFYDIFDIILNTMDGLPNADLNVVNSQYRSRKANGIDSRSLTIDKGGVVIASEVDPAELPPATIDVTDGILIKNGGILQNGIAVPMVINSPSIVARNGGQINFNGAGMSHYKDGSPITIDNGGRLYMTNLGTLTNDVPMTISGYGQGQAEFANFGAILIWWNNAYLQFNTNITLGTAVSRIGGFGAGADNLYDLNGVIDGPGGLDLYGAGAAEDHVWTFNVSGANNTYAGNTAIRADMGARSILKLSGGDQRLPATELYMSAFWTGGSPDGAGAALDLNGNNQTVSKLNLSGPYKKELIDSAGGGTLTVTGDVALNDGKLMLTSGTLDVGGNLVVNGNVIISNQLAISSFAGISGTGTISSFTLPAGSTVAPGNSIGTLTFSSLLMDPGSFYDWEVGTNASGAVIADLFNVIGMFGTSSSANSITVNVINIGATLASGDTNTLFQISGLTTGLAVEFVVTGPGTDSAVIVEDGSYLKITGIVPEPAAFGFLVLLGLAFFRRK